MNWILSANTTMAQSNIRLQRGTSTCQGLELQLCTLVMCCGTSYSHSVAYSEFLKRRINQCCLQPTAGLHVEDVGVTVKCSFSPTNARINLTHSYKNAHLLLSALNAHLLLSALKPDIWEKTNCTSSDSNDQLFLFNHQNLHTLPRSSSALTKLCVHECV